MLKRWLDFALGVPLVWFFGLFSKKQTPPPIQGVKKVLFIKLAAMGDTILLEPVFRSFKNAYPQIQIHWLISPVNQNLALTFPFIDRFWILKKFSLGFIFSLARHLRQEKFDVVVDFEQWARGTPLLAFASGAAHRLGFNSVGQHRAGLFTDTLKKEFNRHEMDEFYDLLSRLGSFAKEKTFHLVETDQGQHEYQACFNGNAKKEEKTLSVLLHPGCGPDGTPREWPLTSYALLAHWLRKQFNATLFLSGGPDERKKTSDLRKLLKGQALDLGGKLTWQGTLSLVKKMDLVVSGNTGVMHLAAALRKKQVALHGPTNKTLWGPVNPHARVLESRCPLCPSLKLGFEYHQKGGQCMKTIELDEVKEAVRSLIDNKK